MGISKDRSSATYYLNVDLDVYSNRDLRPLVSAFGKKANVLYVGRDPRGKYSAHLEITGRTHTADATIRAFCRLIEGLPERARLRWKDATVRSFSIGVQAGTRPNPRDFRIRQSTVKAVSEVGAEIVLTIYAPVEPSPSK